jgi:hypothetical protein
MSKNTRQVKAEHFDPMLREAVEPLIENLANQGANDLQNHLHTRGQKLSYDDYQKLIRKLKGNAAATLTLAVDVTDKKLLEDWNIWPISADQSTFDDVVQSFNVLPEEEDDDTTITLNAGGKSVTATPDEYRDWRGE